MCALYIREYLKSPDGWLNFVEVVIGSALWTMYGTFGASTWSEEFLYTCSCAITSNGGVFLMSSSLSVPTALMLPRLLYYSVFHLVAASCYMFGGVGSVRNESFTDGVTAIVCGSFHVAHFIHSVRPKPAQ
ncbi:uncharacterized protein LOC144118639 [Amblyomma americanum]